MLKWIALLLALNFQSIYADTKKNIIFLSVGDLNFNLYNSKIKNSLRATVGNGYFFNNAFSPDNWSVFYDWLSPLPPMKSFTSNGVARRDDDYLGMYVYINGLNQEELGFASKAYNHKKNYTLFIQNNFLVIPYLKENLEEKIGLNPKEVTYLKELRQNYKSKKFDYLNSLLFAEGKDEYSLRNFEPLEKKIFYSNKNFSEQKNLLLKIYTQKLNIFSKQFEGFWNSYLKKFRKNSLIIIVGNHGEPLFEHDNIHISNDLYNNDFKSELIIIPPDTDEKKEFDQNVSTLMLNQVIRDFIANKKINSEYFQKIEAKDLYFRSCDKRKVAILSKDNNKIVLDLTTNEFKYYNTTNDPDEKNAISQHIPLNELNKLKDFDFDGYFKDKKFKRESCRP